MFFFYISPLPLKMSIEIYFYQIPGGNNAQKKKWVRVGEREQSLWEVFHLYLGDDAMPSTS